jgi:outer membrane lipopolysaccharide assembly protein LptE/RlpB
MRILKRCGFAFPALVLAALLAASAGCGYKLQGTGGFLPAHIKTMAIPMFKNLTTRFQVDLKLTQAVIDEMVARGKVEVVTGDRPADAVLVGEIQTFNVNPIAFTPGQTTADRFNIMVVAKITLRDNVSRKVLFSNPAYVYQEDYEVPSGSDFESVETEALDRIAEKFARALVITILEGF